MMPVSQNPGYFSALCVKVPGAPDPARKTALGVFWTAMGLMAIRIVIWVISGQALDVGPFDIVLGLVLTAGLFLFLATHPAWSQPWPEKGRYTFDRSGIRFERENRPDPAAPDWKTGWEEIGGLELLDDRRGFVLRLRIGGEIRDIEADLLRIENCPPEARQAEIPPSVPRAHAGRLIVRGLCHFGAAQITRLTVSRPPV